MKKKDLKKALELLLNGKALIGNTGQSIILTEDFKKVLKKLKGKKKEKPVEKSELVNEKKSFPEGTKFKFVPPPPTPPPPRFLKEGHEPPKPPVYQELQEGSPFEPDYKAKIKKK
jgi:hypothetical protein